MSVSLRPTLGAVPEGAAFRVSAFRVSALTHGLGDRVWAREWEREWAREWDRVWDREWDREWAREWARRPVAEILRSTVPVASRPQWLRFGAHSDRCPAGPQPPTEGVFDMEILRDRVAVVTGGASGIGRAMARRFAAEGMHLVIADINAERLAESAAELRSTGREVTEVVLDVSRAEDIAMLADTAFDRYGDVAILCNNAGVTKRARSWELTLDDWTWVLGVDLWSVIHGVRTFVPRMLTQGAPAHIVNTSSVTGLMPLIDMASYCSAKSGVVSLSECLAIELAEAGAEIGVSVLAPGFIDTNIGESGAHRPAVFAESAPANRPRSTTGLEATMTADDVAGVVLNAVQPNRFWILSHQQYRSSLVERAEGLGTDARPVSFRVV